MIVGIDGGALSITDNRLKVGVYRVVSNLVKEMLKLDAENNYRIYMFDREGEGRASLAGNLKIVDLPRFGFQRLWLPLALARHPVDVYLGVSQSLPPLHFQKLCDIKMIGFVYDLGFLHYPEAYPGSASRLMQETQALIKHADQLVTVSQASVADLVKTLAIEPNKVSVCYPGVDPVFSSKGAVHQSKRPYFLFVGALKRGKNVPMMLRAFAKFLKETKESSDFLLVGSDYWMDPAIKETIGALGLQERVRIIGFVDDATLAAYYRGAVALLSVSKIEGFGLPAVEAMAAGCPVIGSTVGSYPEVVGKAGILVDPDDTKALTRVMRRIVENSKLTQTMIADGQKRAKLFSWRRMAGQVIKLTYRVCGRKRVM